MGKFILLIFELALKILDPTYLSILPLRHAHRIGRFTRLERMIT